MTTRLEIRRSLPADTPLIESLYPQAFPEEDLLPLVRDLLRDERNVVSLVAIHLGTLSGHIAFTKCSVAGRSETVALLGPLAVAPDAQRRGVGSGLIRDGFECLKDDGIVQVQVLGDPAYYGRFGFEPDPGVTPPYPLPEEWGTAWQSISLRAGAPVLQGALTVPAPWRQKALWAP